MATEQDIDTGNYQMVGLRGDNIIVMFPKSTMTKQEALVHAAWLVAMADDDNKFDEVLTAVQHS